MSECELCGAPGGYPYCNEECRVADMDDAEYQAYIKPPTN